MAFPTTPTNGQVTKLNGITYIYSSSSNAWTRQTPTIEYWIVGNLLANAGTPSTSTLTGALRIDGGAGITGDAHVGGNVVITGNLSVQGVTTTFLSNDIALSDSILNLHTNQDLDLLTSNDGRDIGIKMHYFDTSDSHAFLGRANDTGSLEWYSRGDELTGNVFSGTYGVFKTGEIYLANTTASTDSTTGALKLNGGAGLAGNVNVGGTTSIFTGNLGVGGLTPAEVLHVHAPTGRTKSALRTSFVDATAYGEWNAYEGSTFKGGLTLLGSNYSNATWRDAMVITAATDNLGKIILRTRTSAAYQERVIVFNDGNVVLSSTTPSTTTSTGALVVKGGVGIADGLTAAGTTYIANFSSPNLWATYGSITNFSSSNAQITGGSVTGITGAATVFTATNFSSANATISGSAGTLVITNFTSANAHITGADTNIGAAHDNAVSRINLVYATTGEFTNFSAGNIITANAAADTNTTQVASTAFVHANGGFTSQVVFTTATAGTTTWTIPAATTKVKVTVVGGGGAGGGAAAAIGASGAGGGAGAIGIYYFNGLTPGATITYGVGNGGTVGANGAVGGTGGVSNASVGGVTISAPGGIGGAAGAAASTPYAGGAGGAIATQTGGTAAAFYGAIGSAGGNSWGTAAIGTGIGGMGAPGYEGRGAGRGKVGSTNIGTAGGAGTGAGGGGGNSPTAATTAGYAGGSGAVIFEY